MRAGLLFILFFTAGLIINAQTAQSETISIGTKISMKSEFLHEERSVWVSLPEGYDQYTQTAYPVIYVLDAENNFNYLSSVYHYLSKEPFGVLPQAILVAIANTNRTRDLTPSKASKDMNFAGKKQTMFTESGGNETFMKFITNELYPYMEKNYRSNGYKVLVGHSFGGLLL